jgi:hypothetical protein
VSRNKLKKNPIEKKVPVGFGWKWFEKTMPNTNQNVILIKGN